MIDLLFLLTGIKFLLSSFIPALSSCSDRVFGVLPIDISAISKESLYKVSFVLNVAITLFLSILSSRTSVDKYILENFDFNESYNGLT